MVKVNAGRREEILKSTLIASVDVGSRVHKGYWVTPECRDCKPFDFTNDREGFRKFWGEIEYAMGLFKLKKVLVGFEPTGTYGEALLHYLNGKGAELVQVNPVNTKKFKSIIDNSPLKSDKKDPVVLAGLIRYGHYLSVVIPRGYSAKLRRLTNSRESYVRDRTVLYNRLQSRLSLLFPEFSQAIRDVTGKTGMYLLKRYTKPEAVCCLRVTRLVKEVRKISRGKYGQKQGEALLEFAKSTIGIKEGEDELALEIRNMIAMIEALNKYISEVEDAMEAVLSKIPISKNIMSIEGIGIVTVAGLIGEISDFGAFKSQSAILKYAGLNLYETSSGKHIGVRRITKRGRTLLRKILFYASLNLVREGGVMHKYYKRLVEDNGMPRKKALIAVSRKLLCVIYALVRDNSMFDENYMEQKLTKIAA